MPATRLGRWSMWLAAAFIVLMGVNQLVFMRLSEDVPWRTTLLPFYGIGMLAVGLAAGIVGAVAIVRQKERSFITWLTLVPALFVLFLLGGELLFPH